ncbi:MAG: FecR domain-containing protein [Tannerellaceae bacterium]|jgi:ferric-dicitrate binding protein FerR (iron transport regulator)|nr:FecR domain-containing protein [Tannerellaceae bacterium]
MEKKFVILLEKFLRKEANAEEINRLKELFNQAESKEALTALYAQKWEQASLALNAETDEQMWNYLQKQIALDNYVPVKYPLWKKGLRIAASLLIPLIFACIGYFYSENKFSSSSVPVVVHTGTGQKTDLRLPDGTQVWLNSASSLQYDNTYNQKERIVYLQGEAYFEVSKNEKKRFIVKTDELSIEAVGTSFNVEAYPEDNYIAATLKEGCIRVSNSYRSEWLLPNEKLTFLKNDRSFVKNTIPDAGQSIFWLHNLFVFEQERMEDIAKILERMYGIQIHFASEDLKNIRFSGKIRNTSLDSMLQMIAFVSSLRYSLENDSTILLLKE